ncbi:L,D-transpeptidase family protein [Frigidibacter sp. SD6-1]|uniref:L,D-transpeptidase family protein n=1 Tax=Frigidibacter sp. SD6-1 TaxID=3032581 RepID=UPI0024DFA77E|nr:L,D-transpeptidase family protein [Frigidibacter sp. SD6-1]
MIPAGAISHARRRLSCGASVLLALPLAALLSLGASGASHAQTATFRSGLSEAAAEDAAIAGFYRDHGYATLWTGPGDARRREALFRALAEAGDHGLPVGKYEAEALMQRFHAVQSEAQRARLEVDVTRTFLAYARDVQSGFLTPAAIDPTIVREVPRKEARAQLDGFAAADPVAFIAALPPSAPEYAALQKARLDLVAAIDAGGWGAKVPDGKLTPGDEGAAVIALRDRLIALGYLAPNSNATFDGELSRALQRFQIDNGLTPDGVAGDGTIAEINRSPEERLESVLVAMERLRWMNGLPLGARHVWVNLPDFTAKVVDEGRVTFETVTVVGQNRKDTRSPEFSDQMEFMVINPTWNVPRSITVKEYLPMLQKNPNAARHLRIVDRSGRQVDRAAVDFTQFTERNFPFSMSQAPSDGNALGLVKFMFPNQWNIYLHDTPQKPLFQKEVRAFSHGCIRLGRPFDLAYVLLARQTDDPEGLFHSHLDTRKETVVTLDQPVPVHLVYYTAWPNAEGHIDYRRDVYGRDGAIFEAMRAAGVALPTVQG